MKAISISIVLFLLMAAEKPKPAKPLPKEDKEEMKYACGRKDSTARKCQCPMHAMEASDEMIAMCDTTPKPVECQREHYKEPCEVVQVPDPKHPAHSCSRWCRKDRAICMCHQDQPACVGAEIVPREGDLQ